MGIKTYPFDAAEFLTTDEAIKQYLTLSLESDNPQEIAQALATVAQARGGIERLAHGTGMSVNALQPALSRDGVLVLTTVLKIIHALGVHLTASLVA